MLVKATPSEVRTSSPQATPKVTAPRYDFPHADRSATPNTFTRLPDSSLEVTGLTPPLVTSRCAITSPDFEVRIIAFLSALRLSLSPSTILIVETAAPPSKPQASIERKLSADEVHCTVLRKAVFWLVPPQK